MTADKILRVCMSAMALSIFSLLAACNNGPKTYDECLLQASRGAQNDRQFQTMSQACREKFKVRYQ
jgi:hypothetical protein